MTLPHLSQEPIAGPATGVNWSDDEGVLKTLGMKGVALAVWQRTPADQLEAWLDRLPPDRLPVLKTIVAIEEVEKAICAAALSGRTPARHGDKPFCERRGPSRSAPERNNPRRHASDQADGKARRNIAAF